MERWRDNHKAKIKEWDDEEEEDEEKKEEMITE